MNKKINSKRKLINSDILINKFIKYQSDLTIPQQINYGNYDKINEMGYIPDDTIFNEGSVIFGKIYVKNDRNDSNKNYKDISIVYKS